MHWEIGQKMIKASQIVKKDNQLFGMYITNFLCAIDSVMVTYFRRIMKDKPSLTLEIDGHTADAGVDTRVEAFIDLQPKLLGSVEVDGYSFSVTSESSINGFELLCNDSGAVSKIGSSDYRWSRQGIRFMDRNTFFSQPIGPHGVHCSLRAPWPVYLIGLGDFVLCMCFWGAAACGFVGRAVLGKKAIAHGLIAAGLVHGISGAGFMSMRLIREGIGSLWTLCSWAALGLSIQVFRTDTHVFLACIGSLCVAFRLFVDLTLFDDGVDLALDPPITDLLLAVSGFVGLLIEAINVQLVVASLCGDMLRYDAAWRALQADECDVAALRQLDELSQEVEKGCRTLRARQYNLKRRRRMSLPDTTEAVSGTPDPSRPVRQLEQLYSQAIGVFPAFFRASHEWAVGADGQIRDDRHHSSIHRASTEFFDTVDAHPSVGAGTRISRRLKDPARAAEKARVCYGGDVSRLLDICRLQVSFNSVQDLAACLDMVVYDRRVRIVRLKNMLSPRHNASLTGGFRVRNEFLCSSIFILWSVFCVR
jgi:hypothetical protein